MQSLRRWNAPGRIRTCDRRIRNPVSRSITNAGADTYNGPSDAPTLNPTSWGADRPVDPDLRRVVDAWPTLPEPIRRAMLALVGSVTTTETPADGHGDAGFGNA